MSDKTKNIIKISVLVIIIGVIIAKFTLPAANQPQDIPTTNTPSSVASEPAVQSPEPQKDNTVSPENTSTKEPEKKSIPEDKNKPSINPKSDSTQQKEAESLPQPTVSQKQPVWILFRSTTCQQCREMQKIFDQLKPEFSGKVKFVFYDVNDPANEKLLNQYNIYYIPTTFLYNKDEKRVYEHVGVIPIEEMRSRLKALSESP
ncbi:MAG: thioredoxin fold domain-containing protein [Firmicutes bacterium]|nr:thioredoxin fold domain-containing protein [Bacillota bacterium]